MHPIKYHLGNWRQPFLSLLLRFDLFKERLEVGSDLVRVHSAKVLLECIDPGKLLLADRTAEGSLDNVKSRFEAAAADAAEDHHLELEDAVDHLEGTWSAAVSYQLQGGEGGGSRICPLDEMPDGV